ncbi:SLC13 family permease [Halorubraceae archaeon YAN]|nr:SLC13 family permease [Halorubraceae archaeon YAN]
MSLFGIPLDAAVVFLLIAVVLILFISEVFPNDVTAIGLIVVLAALGPSLGVTTADALSGFSNTATLTIVAMYMLSAGIQQTGIVDRLGLYLASIADGDGKRALVATVCSVGPIAGIINNTPVVAVYVPMISELADRVNVSPSKLLLPLSYAAILGGTLTLVGTSTNILASDLAGQLIDGRDGIGVFEFTIVGIVILFVGISYLLTVGWKLTPPRVPAAFDLIEEFSLQDHIQLVYVREESPIVGATIDEIESLAECNVSILQLRQGQEVFPAAQTDRPIEASNRLTVHGSPADVAAFVSAYTLRELAQSTVTEETFETGDENMLVKGVLLENSPYIGMKIAETQLQEFYTTTVLAVKRDGVLYKTDLAEVTLKEGDLLLLQTTTEAIDYFLEKATIFLVDDSAYDRFFEEDLSEVMPLSSKTPLAVGILLSVIIVAAVGLVPIVIAALGGVFAMLITGCLSPTDAYESVSWNVIFLLAGVIPLGIAMEETGGAAVLATAIVTAEAVVPVVLLLFVFYILTGLLANVITPVATVVLMIPVAVDAAVRIGVNEFTMLLVVMFASATSFMTPVGYQTNLMVYGPGGYQFSDFIRVGAPLQIILAVVTTISIILLWGV